MFCDTGAILGPVTKWHAQQPTATAVGAFFGAWLESEKEWILPFAGNASPWAVSLWLLLKPPERRKGTDWHDLGGIQLHGTLGGGGGMGGGGGVVPN